MAPVAQSAGRGTANSARRRMRGSLLLGMLIGLVVGLTIAVIVAIFVTRAPVPFLKKDGRGAEKALELRPGEALPDPNRPAAKAGEAQPGLPAPIGVPGAGSAPTAVAPAGVPGAEVDGAEKTSYMLQAGAFRNQDDADGVKAKLALIGFEARVIPGEAGGQVLHRVRVGPFATLDEMNKARARLAESGIETAAVRQK